MASMRTPARRINSQETAPKPSLFWGSCVLRSENVADCQGPDLGLGVDIRARPAGHEAIEVRNIASMSCSYDEKPGGGCLYSSTRTHSSQGQETNTGRVPIAEVQNLYPENSKMKTSMKSKNQASG